MIIKNFKATKVHGYLSFDINFMEDITYLIGSNGCGKTTVLKLISGLLLPYYDYLATIKYDTISISLSDNEQDYLIEAKQDKQSIKISFGEGKTSSFPLMSDEDILLAKNDGYMSPRLAATYRTFNESELIKKIRNLTTPIVLGLNRRLPTLRLLRDDYIERRINNNLNRNKNISEIDLALLDIRELMFTHVRQNASQQKDITSRFREALLKETMRLIDMGSFNKLFSDKFNFEREKSKLEEKEKEISSIIKNLGVPELTESINTYFNEAKKLLIQLNKVMTDKTLNDIEKTEKVSPLMMKWVINGAQLEKIDKISELGDKYNEEINYLNSSMIRLKNSLNTFFEETGKTIEITGDGNIIVKMPNGDENTIFNLSSGEKQLIILFGHLIFSTSNNGIFIIDEPELSLHLSWQEKFVKVLQEASPTTQFILATHAPAIINNNKSIKKCINLSKK